ncbi:MAG: putative DNA repair protein MutK [Algoriphagus sp.]|jgi:predicted DNA repair protein MutK
MASGFFALLDDIATVMDDVAVMSKVAAKKTAGILGDDLAVNAEKASGFVTDRELPVLWAITKGSFLNKLIILPFAFLLSAFLPPAVTIILVLGGLYLAFEGVEKIYEYFFPHEHFAKVTSVEDLTAKAIIAAEKVKVKSAILTDFILSVEIVIIALGTVVEKPISTQIVVVSLIAILATVGVYGIVAIIVRMDEFGIKLINLNAEENSFSDKVGRVLVSALPKIIKSMTVIGTIALLLVSGGIFAHNIEFFHHFLESWPSIIKEFLIGLVVGFVVLLVVSLFKKVFSKKAH